MKMRWLVLWMGALGGALSVGGCASGSNALGDDPAGENEGGAAGDDGGEGGDAGDGGTTSTAGKGGKGGSGGSAGKGGSSSGSGGSGGSTAGSGGSTSGSGGSSGKGGSGGGGSAGSAGGPGCGDGQKQASEQCDKADLGGQTCASALDPSYGGKLACKTNCQFDFSGCAKNPTCGDGAINTNTEECDDNDFGGQTCAKILNKPGASGALNCTAQCKVDSSGCKPGPYCGDGKKGSDEACDGKDFGGATCASVLKDPNKGGILGCSTDCKVDSSKCVDNPKCGDNAKNNTGEQCDGADLDGATCKSAMGNQKAEGTVSCSADCKFDTSKCTIPPYCGDNKINNTEKCDGADFGGATCESLLGKGHEGKLVCSPDCTISTAQCVVVPYCGDGQKNGTEPCEGSDLGAATCASAVGTGSTGTVSCSADCTLDVSQCTVPPTCGNGKIDSDKGEACDGSNLNGNTCAKLLGDTHATGTTTCTSSCTVDSSSCTIPPYCGDGKLNAAGEECDDGNTAGGDGCDKNCKVQCFDGETKFAENAHCYVDSYSFGDELSWDEAESLCVQSGGHLLSITSASEHEFVYYNVISKDFFSPSARWIGLNDKVSEGSFSWTSGEPLSVTVWDDGEPNNSGNEDCVGLYESDGSWNDKSCSYVQPYICEYPPPVKFP